MVPKLVPGALRIELALTEAEPSDVGMDIVSTIIPPAGMVSGAKGLATGTPAFVGRASIEAKVNRWKHRDLADGSRGSSGWWKNSGWFHGFLGTISTRHLSIGRLS